MEILWDEPLGLVAKCECCLAEKTIRFDRRKVQRNRVHEKEGERHAA